MNIIEQNTYNTSAVNLPPGSAAVVANFYASLFGGPLSQLLKCLTAVKVSAEFEEKGIAATPVCLVRQGAPPGFSPDEIILIDRSSMIHCMKSSGIKANAAETAIDGNGDETLFEEIEQIFSGGDSEYLAAFKEAFYHCADSVSSCARWLKYLLKDFGVTVVENSALPRYLPKSGMLPVAAIIADSSEIAEYVKEAALYEREGILRPIVRSLPDVTISSVRIMKTLKRYGLDFARILDGKERVMGYMRETLKSDVPARLKNLRNETAAVLDEMETAAFAARGGRSVRIIKERAARIIYQLEKIQKHSIAALADKEKSAENRISRACDYLSPLGRRQQDTLGGAQIPLYYGRAGLRKFYERLDITTSNHQLIEMD